MPGRARRFLSGTRPQPHPLHLLSGHVPWARRSAIWRVRNWAACGDGAGPSPLRHPGLIIAALLWRMGGERSAVGRTVYRGVPHARIDSWAALERIVKRRLRLVRWNAFLTAFGVAAISFTFGAFVRAAAPAHLQESSVPDLDVWPSRITFALGGISAWVPTFLHRVNGFRGQLPASWSAPVTVIDGIGRHSRWRLDCAPLATYRPRALYLVSFWEVVFTISLRVVFFGPQLDHDSCALLRRVLHLRQYRSAQCGHRETRCRELCVLRLAPLISSVSTPSATPSHRRSSAPSAITHLEHRSGATLGFVVCRLLDSLVRARFAPPYYEAQAP